MTSPQEQPEPLASGVATRDTAPTVSRRLHYFSMNGEEIGGIERGAEDYPIGGRRQGVSSL